MTPAQVGFPGAQTIAKLVRTIRRQGKETTETVYLISSLTLAQMDARGMLKHKRLYWVIESRLHQPLDVSLDEDRSRVRHRKAALVLGMFRRLAVSLAWHWIDRRRVVQRRGTVRAFQARFHQHQTGPTRLGDLIFATHPLAWASVD